MISPAAASSVMRRWLGGDDGDCGVGGAERLDLGLGQMAGADDEQGRPVSLRKIGKRDNGNAPPSNDKIAKTSVGLLDPPPKCAKIFTNKRD